MKIIIYNPHTTDLLGKPLFFLLNNRFSVKKFAFLAKFIGKNPEKFIFYIDSSSSFRQLTKIIPLRIEIFLWCLLNWINPLRIKKIYSQKELDWVKNAVFFFFIFDNLIYKDANIPKFNGMKFAHLNHFHINTSIISDNLQRNKIDFFIAENNLWVFPSCLRFFSKIS